MAPVAQFGLTRGLGVVSELLLISSMVHSNARIGDAGHGGDRPSIPDQAMPPIGRVKAIVLGAVVAIWLGAVIAGMAGLARYSTAPGAPGHPPARWPAASTLARAANGFTLVMIAHPRCPCTRATVGELAMLMAHAGGRMRALVVFVKPPGTSGGWATTDLWFSAARIPGVTVVADDGGEARRFGAATSGQTMVYDGAGRLLFSGGITVARGHWGDNLGASEIRSLMETPAGPRAITPVFGCPLFEPAGPPAGRAIRCVR